MPRFLKQALCGALLCGAAATAPAFSLLGLPDTYQVPALTYMTAGDIGAPKNLGEEYRWDVPVITYSYDESFLNYFGSNGVLAVERAISILNEVPAFSAVSSNLSEYPLDSRRVNARASALGLRDVKSTALALLTEELGLAEPDRWTWAMRARATIGNPPTTNYLVIQRNFDPITWAPTRFVNGVPYTYHLEEPSVNGIPTSVDAFEDLVPANNPVSSFSAVASFVTPIAGAYYFGLSRDDIGGLRYIYRANNYNVQTLPPDVVVTNVGIGGCCYDIFFPGNFTGLTNGTTTAVGPVTTALRPGINKIQFQRVNYDSLFERTLVTNFFLFTDSYVTNSQLFSQQATRTVTQPDVLFTAEDLGVVVASPVLTRRTAGFLSQAALNGQTTQFGPGVIRGTVLVSFSTLLPSVLNQVFGNPVDGETEGTGIPFAAWASFDGTTNAPSIYPNVFTIRDIERQVLGN
jgi:hypothetical protein